MGPEFFRFIRAPFHTGARSLANHSASVSTQLSPPTLLNTV